MSIPANSVEVAKIYQARCKICPWSGELLGSYQEANGDRRAHLQEHEDEGRVDQPIVRPS